VVCLAAQVLAVHGLAPPLNFRARENRKLCAKLKKAVSPVAATGWGFRLARALRRENPRRGKNFPPSLLRGGHRFSTILPD